MDCATQPIHTQRCRKAMKKRSHKYLILSLLALGLAIISWAIFQAAYTNQAPTLPRDTSVTKTDNFTSQSSTPTVIPTLAVPLPPTISGTVMDAQGPVVDAIVQVQGMPNQTTTSANGAFILSGITGTYPITVTAWSYGNYIGWAVLDPHAPDWKGEDTITINLKPYVTKDNHEYSWFSFEGVEGSKACGLCHR